MSSFVEELVGPRPAVFLDLSRIECSVGLAKTLMAKTHLSYYSVDLYVSGWGLRSLFLTSSPMMQRQVV